MNVVSPSWTGCRNILFIVVGFLSAHGERYWATNVSLAAQLGFLGGHIAWRAGLREFARMQEGL